MSRGDSLESVEKFTCNQMKEKLLADKELSLQLKETKIINAEHSLIEREKAIKEEYKRINIRNQNITKRENELVEKTAKLEYDMAMGESTNIEASLILKAESINSFETREREELVMQRQLLQDKESNLIKLQKTILRRENDLAKQKVNLDYLKLKIQEAELELNNKIAEHSKNTQTELNNLKAGEENLLQREKEYERKYKDLLVIKEDMIRKSKIIYIIVRIETRR